MSIFQVAATLFALFMLYWVRTNQKRQFLTVLESSFWYACWSLFIIISIFPQLLLGIVHTIRFTRVFDLLTVIAFMLLIMIIFSVYIKNKQLEKKLETLVRKFAIEKK